MPDLFYSVADSFREQMEMLKTDISTYAKATGYKGRRKIKLLYGDEKNINNNILIVHPPVVGKDYFSGAEFAATIELMNKMEMFNHFITYAVPIPFVRQNKDTVKEFRTWISKITDMIGSKIIVVLGEDAQLVFFSKKHLLKDSHGKIIGKHQGIPVFASYPFAYYASHSAYEDRTYKEFIQKHDWQAIKQEYDRRIKCQ